MTFGYDYCSPYNMLTHKSARTMDEETECIFTKDSEVWKEYVLEGIFYDVWDIRENDCNHLIHNDGINKKEKTIEYLKSLPNDSTFFYCDAHL